MVFQEQGDPFPEGELRGTTIRLVVAIVFTVAVILSNADKNTNAYNMIQPREPILHELLSQLIRDNFTILTRLTSIRL